LKVKLLLKNLTRAEIEKELNIPEPDQFCIHVEQKGAENSDDDRFCATPMSRIPFAGNVR
jgi:hypothetical protein